MPCHRVQMTGGVVIVCTRGRKKAWCPCGREAPYACDYVAPGRSRSCSKPLCGACAVVVGPDVHHCAGHPAPGIGQIRLF